MLFTNKICINNKYTKMENYFDLFLKELKNNFSIHKNAMYSILVEK